MFAHTEAVQLASGLCVVDRSRLRVMFDLHLVLILAFLSQLICKSQININDVMITVTLSFQEAKFV